MAEILDLVEFHFFTSAFFFFLPVFPVHKENWKSCFKLYMIFSPADSEIISSCIFEQEGPCTYARVHTGAEQVKNGSVSNQRSKVTIAFQLCFISQFVIVLLLREIVLHSCYWEANRILCPHVFIFLVRFSSTIQRLGVDFPLFLVKLKGIISTETMVFPSE